MPTFQEAAEGIRTLDLLHGKQDAWFPLSADVPCKRGGSRAWASGRESPPFTGKPRGFGHPMGTQALSLRLPRGR
jgi:hypothetical protein